MATCQVRFLTLNKGENLERTLYRLEKGWHLRFVLGPSLHASTVRLFCNHPREQDEPFERTTYYELQWKSSSGSKSDSHDVYSEIPIVLAGSFNYYFTVDNSRSNVNGQGYFLVDPTLSVGTGDEQLTLDCLQCQSVLAKCLGPFHEWEGRLYVAKATGYNLIHLTPIQALGTSNSSYSIKDQLQFNPIFNNHGAGCTFEDVDRLIQKMNREWHVLCMTDLVYNHSADNSPWLEEHPECGFNLENSPHLKTAYLLDRIFANFSREVADGKWKHRGIPPEIATEETVKKIGEVLRTHVLPDQKMHEFYTVSVDDIIKRFKHGIEENRPIPGNPSSVSIIQDPTFQRNACRVDMDAVLKLYNTDRPGATSRSQRIQVCCDMLRRDLETMNSEKTNALLDHLNEAVTNFLANIRWRFLDPKGPKHKIVTKKDPLMHDYFIVPEKFLGSLAIEEGYMYGDSAKFIFACNGWVMHDDPLKNFAEPGSNVYLRRELVGWGDSAKLRYGKKPEDCPYLWQRMKDYTEMTARMFHSVRLDNCHSTPIHVAEYMLDAARKIRPDLYVVAELFTGGEHLDNLFINRLGINSLIREAMSPETSRKLGALIHRYGGQPVGAFVQPRIQPLMPTMAHALFFDQTHDNPSPIKTLSAFTMLPNAALVSMACCATGSNRGYDQMVPHHIHVVTEDRKYPSWADWDFPDRPYINQTFGITRAKTLINNLHFMLGAGGVKTGSASDRRNFSQVYVDQIDEDTVSVTRHNPVTHESIVLVARTAFNEPEDPEKTAHVRPITLEGVVETILFEIQTFHTDAYEYVKDADFINGLPDYYLKLQENIPPSLSKMCTTKVQPDGMATVVNLQTFTPGSVIAFKIALPSKAQKAILEIRRGLGQFGYLMRSYSGRTMFDETFDTSNFRAIVSDLSLADLNIALFRNRSEEEADGKGFGVYNIPGFGDMTFCGLRGVSTVLSNVRPRNDLGHPLCNNLRDGDWLPAYIAKRLQVHEGTIHLGNWFENLFKHLSQVPRYLIPSYFDAIITGAYVILRSHAYSLMSDFVADGSTFVQALAMGSVMFCGYVKDAELPQLSPNLAPPKPPLKEGSKIATPEKSGKVTAQKKGGENSVQQKGQKKVSEENQACSTQQKEQKKELEEKQTCSVEEKEQKKVFEENQACLSIAAGFPHFSSSYMRNWGRDTFIALRGLLLLTGRYNEARYVILAYAGAMRHGLIPNLLNKGIGARYNCRDAVWFWLQSIQDYCNMVPEGLAILKDTVARIYPTDDAEPQGPGEHDQPLVEVVQEALQKHAAGIKFRERRAGAAIDEHMTDKGFDMEVGVKWDLGFVYGGNEHNCGTWMDKMGSSNLAGNSGKPATPRDGSAVELIGLSASSMLWLDGLHKAGHYPYSGVTSYFNGNEEQVSFLDWYNLIKKNFEFCFWVNTEPVEGEQAPELIAKRGIYKDTYFATQFWTNTQLRPNFPIAMVVAPDLFNPDHAWTALGMAQKILLGPLGMKTLDPDDWSYVPYYDNRIECADAKIAKGFSYHQGPEWVWPIGYFLRAKLLFAKKLESSRPGILKETVLFIRTTLTRHYEEVMNSSWRSLPELTNHNGEPNMFGCPAQAWSVSCVLDVLYDLENLDNSVTITPSKSTENLVVAPL
ncbi:glycogen debranching enzyme-like isoform X2 [Mya arenaria]|uniref:glycogen debranching enzyme-like isoform X2 n=1 Tax=Mya arenaria TaxID=6604 RepID=UPI0022E16F25|nr:glycogen debranching enzyme-like isoform X2 [Mya arenaria]